MKPIILYDEDINVNLNTCFGDEEDATVNIVIDKKCFAYSENMILKNNKNNKMSVQNIDNFGIMNPSYVMHIFNNYKNSTE